MLDKNAFVKDLEEMIKRRQKEASHLEFYMNPQKIMISDIIELINSGKYDVKKNIIVDQDDAPDAGVPVRALGCWSPDW